MYVQFSSFGSSFAALNLLLFYDKKQRLLSMKMFVLQESNPLLGEDAVWGPNVEEFRQVNMVPGTGCIFFLGLFTD